MTRRLVFTIVAHGLIVTSVATPAGLIASEQTDAESRAVLQIEAAAPDTLFINGRAYILK